MDRRVMRWAVACAVTVLALVLVQGGKVFFLAEIERSWAVIRDDIDGSLRDRLTKTSREFTEPALAAARALSEDEDVLALLAGTRGRDECLERILRTHPQGKVSFEIRNTSDELLAYRGTPVPPNPPEIETGRERVAIVEGGLQTDIVIRRPVQDSAGHRLGTVSTALPLANALPMERRFERAEDLVSRLAEEENIPVQVASGRHRALLHDGRYLAVPVIAGNDTVGFLAAMRTNPTMYRERVGAEFDRLSAFLLSVLCFLAVGFVVVLVRRMPSEVLRFLAGAGSAWLARYVLLWSGATSLLMPEALKNPASFASSFGGGIASSVGELTITMVLFAGTLAAATRLRPRALSARILPFAVFALAVLLTPFCMRGVVASLESFVADSSFNYDSVSPLLADPLAILMLVNAFLLIAGAFLAAGLACRFFEGSDRHEPGEFLRLLPLAAFSFLLFAYLSRKPLIPLWWYGLALVLFLAAPFAMGILRRRGFFRPVLLTVVLAAASTATAGMLFQRFMHDRRRAEIEAMADRLARPVDGWSRVLAEQAADALAGELAQEEAVITSPGGVNTGPAFRLWAHSSLGAERNNSAVLISDDTGRVLSRFHVGIHPRLFETGPLADLPLSTGDSIVRIAIGETPPIRTYAVAVRRVVAGDGSPLRLAVIVEGLDPLTVTAQDFDPLRSVPTARSIAPEDRLTLATFRGGKLKSASDPTWPHTLGIPSRVKAMLEAGSREWAEVEAPDGVREALYFRTDGDTGGEVTCIAMGKPEPLLTLYRFLRMGVLFLCLSFAALAGIFFPRSSIPSPARWNFSTKLQLAILAAASIPVLIVWTGARNLVSENERRAVESRLLDDLRVLRETLLASVGSDLFTTPPGRVSDGACIDAALRVGKDIAVYRGAFLEASSRPELFAAGILTPRLPPDAFLAVAVRDADYSIGTERIGGLPYFVGFIPIRGADGSPVVVLSTMTLFERHRTEYASARASATILLGTAVIVLLVLGASKVLARQISRPLQQLITATRAVAEGDLERRADVEAKGEIGELVHAFNIMIDRLRENRERLAAAERDSAWREMAKQVAHEIRNPLTPMKLAVQHLEKAAKDRLPELPDVIGTVVRTIIDQIDTLARISDEFSRFARMPRRAVADVEPANV
ncbi:MAG: HAMP domain-containing protein, partial [Bacteroidota bacterium]|nr:HAMP domain-containing protein [Bacteroidota bacterium]